VTRGDGMVDAKDLLELMAKALVDKPEVVDVKESEEGESTVLELHVDPEDVGKIIGKQGRTVRALRTILDAAGQKFERRYEVEVIE
jgi:predicted RNA-binding protein YlqC (UPF0109 family)